MPKTDWNAFKDLEPQPKQRIEAGIKREDKPFIFPFPFTWHPGGYCFSEEKDQDGESMVVIRPPFITHWRAAGSRS